MTQANSLTTFPTASYTTSNNNTYHYIHIPPASTNPKPTILLLHGFPSIPYDFHHQITHLTSLGHGILCPYLLGYFPSSTPTNCDAYRLKSMCSDLIALLNHLNLTSPIPAIGHDWGVSLLSRLEYYHPTRLSKLAYLTIAPSPFGATFDLDTVNTMTKQMLGYEGFGYQKFFMDDRVYAAELLQHKHDRMDMLMFAKDSTELWKESFARLGGLESWLKGKHRVDQFVGVSEELVIKRVETFIPQEGEKSSLQAFGPGYSGSLMWYVALNTNINLDDERNERSNWETYKTNKAVLLVLSEKDPIALADMQVGMAEGHVENTDEQLRVQKLASGHFVILERPDELNKILEDFLQET